MSERLEKLVEAVATLASDPAKQLKHLEQLELPEAVDELALEYDAIAAAADDMLRLGELDQNQYDSIKKLDDLLSQMSSKAKSQLWTTEALFQHRNGERYATRQKNACDFLVQTDNPKNSITALASTIRDLQTHLAKRSFWVWMLRHYQYERSTPNLHIKSARPREARCRNLFW